MITQAQKLKIISKYIKTAGGRAKLAMSMINPLLEKLLYRSLPALILKSIEWCDHLQCPAEIITQNRRPKLRKFTISGEVLSEKIGAWGRLIDVFDSNLVANENNELWKLVEKAIKNKIVKTTVRKKLTIAYLELLSEKYDYLVCHALVYSKFRKMLANHYRPDITPGSMLSGLLSGLLIGQINNMRIIVTGSAPKDSVFFFKDKCGVMARNIDSICITMRGKKAKVTLEQQFYMSIDPKNIFSVCLQGD